MDKRSSRHKTYEEALERMRIIKWVCVIAAIVAVCAGVIVLAVVLHRNAGRAGTDENLPAETEYKEETASDLFTDEETQADDAENERSELSLEEMWEDDFRTPTEVKGVYLGTAAVGRQSTVDYVIELLDETEINAVVINIKDDDGSLTVNLDIPMAEEITEGEDEDQLIFESEDELRALVDTLKEHGAYMIARISAFRDDRFAALMPECSLRWKEEYGGDIYCDNQGYHWLDPANETVRQYILDISQAAADIGFDEIQYDYVRFPTTYTGRVEYYGGSGYYEEDGETYNEEAASLRKDTITSFVEYVCRELAPQGVFVSADVYGIVLVDGESSGNVGQDYASMAKWLDYICPMVYPSHYENDMYGVEYPDTEPYAIVKAALSDSADTLSGFTSGGGHCAKVRPWMQAFTANYLENYIEYDGTVLREEIDAVYDVGYSEWLVWQSAGNYEEYRSAFLPAS